jgi:DNA-directed RNA polymerase specialized sigma24 family protein
MSSSFFELSPHAAALADELPKDEEVSRVEHVLPERRTRSGTSELPVQLAVRGTRSPGPEWRRLVGRLLERTLQRLLGPDAPLEPLLESALFEALSSWPPRSDQPMALWGQRIATGVAFGHLKSAEPAPLDARPEARTGSLRELLGHVHAWLRTARPPEQLAFALLELNSSSVSEASLILRAAPSVVRTRADFLRRQLLFAARRDLQLARFLRLGPRLQALLRHWDRAELAAPPSQRTRRLSAAVELELEWFL